MFKYVDIAKDIYFNVIINGINYFENLFSTPYQFGKIDFVWIPDYDWGAMENVGCIVMKDAYV